MTQYQLDSAVAVTTGESLETITQLGFVPLTVGPYERERRVYASREDKEQEDEEIEGRLRLVV